MSSSLASRLRHRVTIERLVPVQDEIGGEARKWVAWASSVPAEILPISAGELLAANQVHGEVVARIVIRWRSGVEPSMRVVHGDDVYQIAGVIPDNKSGREHITLPVSRGVRNG